MKGDTRRKITKLKMRARRHAPAALTIFGSLIGVAAAVWACHKARHMDENLEEYDEAIKAAEEAKAEAEEILNNLDETAEDETVEEAEEAVKAAKKSVRIAKAKRVGKVIKMFALPVAAGILSLAMIAGSYTVMAADLGAATMALKKVEKSYKSYREATIEKYGEEVDKELRFGKMQSKVKDKTCDPDTGEVYEVEKMATKVGDDGFSDYAIPFCRTYCGTAFQDSPYYDNLTIVTAIKDAENILRRDGSVFLSDMYKGFNFSQTPDSRIVGRIIHEGEDPNTAKIEYTVTETVFDFARGENGEHVLENGYIIDFKGLEVIYDKLPKPKTYGLKRPGAKPYYEIL